ncbi:hypothetical protein [Abditibacterium utsteinense]|nr:hypothetical protein [Abditibacterium utsteinense]
MSEPNREIQWMIEKANHILISNGINRIQENEDFIQDEFSFEHYVVYTIEKSECIRLRLQFDKTGIDIGINDFHEVHSLGYEEIVNDSYLYEQYLDELFFNSVIIKKCHFGLWLYYVENSNKEIKLVRKVRFGCLNLLFMFIPIFPVGCESLEFRPLYTRN